jgi:hypothetical protein
VDSIIFKRNGKFIGGGNGVLFTNVTNKNTKIVYFGFSTTIDKIWF